jgi:hypothetical protein
MAKSGETGPKLLSEIIQPLPPGPSLPLIVVLGLYLSFLAATRDILRSTMLDSKYLLMGYNFHLSTHGNAWSILESSCA